MWDDARQLSGVSLALFIVAIVSLVWAALGWLVRQPAFAFREVVITTPLCGTAHAQGKSNAVTLTISVPPGRLSGMVSIAAVLSVERVINNKINAVIREF